MTRGSSALAVAGTLLALQVSSAGAVNPPCPPGAAGTSAASGARLPSPAPTCPAPDPTQAAYDHLRAQLGGDLAQALAGEQQLALALDQTAAGEQILTGEVTGEEARIAALEDRISQLDTQISQTQDRIDVERTQVAAMARAIYRQPDSLWVLIARTGNLRDALLATADLVVAGQRAHALEMRLQADLEKLRADRATRAAELDRERALRDGLVADLSALEELMNTQNGIGNQLGELTRRIQDAAAGLQSQPPEVTANLAQALEQEELDLLQAAYQQAWSQAQVGTGLALLAGELPAGRAVAGLSLAWPMAGARVTQPFGPTSLVLEPPLGPFPHFHAGIDIAAPLGTPVMAAADGIVVAVGHSGVGYGNYVVVAHGGGIMTLYGHLLETDVLVGDLVVRGQRVGLEGSSGYSTGPHVHFELRVDGHVVDPMPYLPILAAPAESPA